MKSNRLPIYILIGIALGVVAGWIAHKYSGSPEEAKQIASYFSVVTDIFLRLVKVIIGPLVFATLVSGIANLSDAKSAGRIGVKSMVWFLSASVLSLSLGMVLVNLFEPGAGLNLQATANAAPSIASGTEFSLKTFIAHVFPRSIAEAMANNEILQIVVFSVLFGFAMAPMVRAGNTKLAGVVEDLADVMFKFTNYVMTLTPIAVFAAIAAAITTEGLGLLVDYGKLLVTYYFGIALLWAGLITAGYFFLGKRIFELVGLVKVPVLLAFSTCSSESGYPKALVALEKFGIPKKYSSFVMPLGYSFNLDGSMMYQAFAIMFIAQAYNIDLSFTQQLLILLTLMVTSKGMAGVARASVVVVAATLPMFNLPEAGLLLLIGIDQILDMARTGTNMLGNTIATAVIAKTESENEAKAQATEAPLQAQKTRQAANA